MPAKVVMTDLPRARSCNVKLSAPRGSELKLKEEDNNVFFFPRALRSRRVFMLLLVFFLWNYTSSRNYSVV